MGNNRNSTVPQEAADGPGDSLNNSMVNVGGIKAPAFTDDVAVTKILSNKTKLAQFREMVIMHIKKNDLQQKLVASDFEKTSNDIMLPLSSFKQCL